MARIPLELPLHVADEGIRFCGRSSYFTAEVIRDRTRCRMASKSFGVSGVTACSAAFSNQASSSGVISKGMCCCSRTDRMSSLSVRWRRRKSRGRAVPAGTPQHPWPTQSATSKLSARAWVRQAVGLGTASCVVTGQVIGTQINRGSRGRRGLGEAFALFICHPCYPRHPRLKIRRRMARKLPSAALPFVASAAGGWLCLDRIEVRGHASSKRSRFITLFQAAMKSWTNCFCASALP